MFGLEDEIRNDFERKIESIMEYIEYNCPEHLEGVCNSIDHPPKSWTWCSKGRLDACYCGKRKKYSDD